MATFRVVQVKMLLKKGANPNQKSWLPIGKDTIDSRTDSDEEYPIHIAAAHGNVKIMQVISIVKAFPSSS